VGNSIKYFLGLVEFVMVSQIKSTCTKSDLFSY